MGRLQEGSEIRKTRSSPYHQRIVPEDRGNNDRTGDCLIGEDRDRTRQPVTDRVPWIINRLPNDWCTLDTTILIEGILIPAQYPMPDDLERIVKWLHPEQPTEGLRTILWGRAYPGRGGPAHSIKFVIQGLHDEEIPLEGILIYWRLVYSERSLMGSDPRRIIPPA